jgi:hypothetical protein
MKKLLMVSNGEHLAARILQAALVLLTTLALGTMFWVATTPVARAQDMTPQRMIEAELPHGKTVETAGKAEFLTALCRAVQRHHAAAPAIVSFAVDAHTDWQRDIMRTAFRCIGTDDCRFLGRVLRAVISGHPDDANALTQLAIELAPSCSDAFGGGNGGGDNGGNFENAPMNLNPPPGSIGGGGGQGNVIAICHNGHTIFVSPQGAENHLRNHPGDRLGACVVTPFQNN